MAVAPVRTRHGIGELIGAEYVWAIAFAAAVCDHVPRLRHLSDLLRDLARRPAGNFTRELFSDPRYLTAVLNTMLYVGIGVNLKMVLAFLLSGFFMRKRWWVKALLVVFILPWATPALPAYMSIHWFVNGQWGMLNNLL